MSSARRTKPHYLGCLCGGALGDALGAPVEFMDAAQIRRRYGRDGIREPPHPAEITDDTQMTLFTAEGLLRAHNRMLGRGICSVPTVVGRAYRRWYQTQTEPFAVEQASALGWMCSHEALWARRAPGDTCLASLEQDRLGTLRKPLNDSDGCGAVMRMAPVGLVRGVDHFGLGCELAALTHGHPDGYLAAGAFAHIVGLLADGAELVDAIAMTVPKVRRRRGGDLTARLLVTVLAHADERRPTAASVESFGGGWSGSEALAIGVYCALVAPSYRSGVILAANHSGDSDSTASIAGNLLGLLHGVEAIPTAWRRRLGARELIELVASDLWMHFGNGRKPARTNLSSERRPYDWDRYPGN